MAPYPLSTATFRFLCAIGQLQERHSCSCSMVDPDIDTPVHTCDRKLYNIAYRITE